MSQSQLTKFSQNVNLFIVTLPSSSETIDMNKFMLKENTYEQNFAGLKTGIVDIQNIRRLHIQGDTYTKNGGQYQEALNLYGTISSSGTVNQNLGAYKLEAFFLKDTYQEALSFFLAVNSVVDYFPVAPLIIEGTAYLHAEGLTFDNNVMPEAIPIYTAKSLYRPAQ